jgi:hypothetical protein
MSKFCYRKGQPKKKLCVNAHQTKRVLGVQLESACRSSCKQFVIMEYSGICYNERMLQRTNATTNECYNEQCYNERMLQRTVFVNKIRMLQRIQMLQGTRKNTIGRRSTRVRMTYQDSRPKEYER